MFLAHEISRPHTISANVELLLVNIYVRFYSGISLLLRIEFKRVTYGCNAPYPLKKRLKIEEIFIGAFFGAPNAATLEEKTTPPPLCDGPVSCWYFSFLVQFLFIYKNVCRINTNIKISGCGIWMGNLVCFREIDSMFEFGKIIAGKLIGYWDL